jgi:hypothetical protein
MGLIHDQQIILKKRRLLAHLEALSALVNEQGVQLLTDEEIEEVLEQEEPYVLPEVISEAFRREDTCDERLPCESLLYFLAHDEHSSHLETRLAYTSLSIRVVVLMGRDHFFLL